MTLQFIPKVHGSLSLNNFFVYAIFVLVRCADTIVAFVFATTVQEYLLYLKPEPCSGEVRKLAPQSHRSVVVPVVMSLLIPKMPFFR